MTRIVGQLLGNRIGKFLNMEFEEGGVAWGQTLWIRIELDITKPLRRGVKVAFQDQDPVWVTFKYEHLSNFCYLCGYLWHRDKDCHVRILLGAGERGHGEQYEAWMRASPLREGSKPIREAGGNARKASEVNNMGCGLNPPMMGGTPPRHVTMVGQSKPDPVVQNGEILGGTRGKIGEDTFSITETLLFLDLLPFKRSFTREELVENEHVRLI
ncbi:hypothetical protein LOK49_LG08G01031 [Camellia lanceoleosa]|uniref:Uncharacterized protein n=1 Tax=Camellia lanceoleosa TaxID=1840588 RepID=A0ACC0GTJ5_9ERIC|nr:hypothetical protein LOK49_LG08G01031 [Camellia lanceoleosa]